MKGVQGAGLPLPFDERLEMKTKLFAAALAATITFGTAALAQDDGLEATFKDIEATLGVVPSHFKTYPPSALAVAPGR